MKSGTIRTMRALLLAAPIVAPLSVADPPAESKVRTFITCPIYRDTDAGRKSGCWLATDLASGVRYDVTDALIKPLLGREVLVEGMPSATDSHLCGGVVLEPVSVSVLESECKPYLIPAEDHPGRRFTLPAKTLQPAFARRVAPPPPYESRTWTMYFELNSDFLLYQHAEVIIDDAVAYIEASKPERVIVTGYADTQGFDVTGRRIVEDIAIAQARAQMLQEALLRLGVPREIIRLEWQGDPEPDASAQSGLVQQSQRRATIRILL